MSIEQEIQNILDRNFTRGDNAKALKELLVLYDVVGRSEQLCDPLGHNADIIMSGKCSNCSSSNVLN